MITIPVNNRGRTVIGRLGENEHRCIAFRDSAAVLQMYPSAAVTVLHQRPGDPAAYPVGSQYVAIDSGVVKWMVQSGDLSAAGSGLCELVFTQGGTVAKTMIYQTEIMPALDGAGTPPEPWEGWVTEVAEDAAEARAWATGTKQDGSPVDPGTAQFENNAKYYSEQAASSAGQITNMTAQATTLQPGSSATASYSNGVLSLGIPKGADGTNGDDGHDGVGVPSGGTTGQVLAKKTGTDYDTEWVNQSSGGVSDVQVNGTSIVSQGVANVPIASAQSLGLVKQGGTGYSVSVESNGVLKIVGADTNTIKVANANSTRPIVPSLVHTATFYGLAKAAGDSTQSASSNAVGVYTDGAIDKILTMLGIDALIAKHEGATASENKTAGDVFIYNGKLYKATDSISSGAAIVPGTNCTQTTIIDILKGV